jgi:hypothetical protein
MPLFSKKIILGLELGEIRIQLRLCLKFYFTGFTTQIFAYYACFFELIHESAGTVVT